MFVCVTLLFIATSFAASNLILFCSFLLGPFRFFFTSLGHKRNAKQKKELNEEAAAAVRAKHNGRSNETNFHCYYVVVVSVVVPVFVVPCGVSFPFSCCLLLSVVFLFFAPFFFFVFFFLHKANVSQTLIAFYFYVHSQLGEEFWAATNCDKG